MTQPKPIPINLYDGDTLVRTLHDIDADPVTFCEDWNRSGQKLRAEMGEVQRIGNSDWWLRIGGVAAVFVVALGLALFIGLDTETTVRTDPFGKSGSVQTTETKRVLFGRPLWLVSSEVEPIPSFNIGDRAYEIAPDSNQATAQDSSNPETHN